MEDQFENEIPSSTQDTQPNEPVAPKPVETISPEQPIQTKSKVSKVKLTLSIFLLVVLIIAGVGFNLNFIDLFSSLINPSQLTQRVSNKTESVPKDKLDVIPVGTQTVKMGEGGKSEVLLSDGESRITFGGGTPLEVVSGKNRNLNDIHNINYLSISGVLSFYNKGYLIDIKNTGCRKQRKFFGDYWAEVTTDCTLDISTLQQDAPIKHFEPFSKEVTTQTSFNNSVNQPDGPLVHVVMPKLSIQNFSTKFTSENVSLQAGSMTSYSTSTPWDILIVTSYGIETIRYNSQEIWDKEIKEVKTGPLTTKSEVKNLDCRVVFTGDEGQQTQQCNVTVEFSFSQDQENLVPIKLATYSQ